MPEQPTVVQRSLFEAAIASENLLAGWLKVRANRGAAGGDGIDVRTFEIDLATHLSQLATSVRLGTYVPGPHRILSVPKRRGGFRQLRIPCVGDRVLQSAVALAIQPLLEAAFEDASYAYRPGRSIRMAVARIDALRRQGFGWVIEGDIRTYFDAVPHDGLLTVLDKVIRDANLCALVRLWLRSAFPDGRGLPQGAPISPALANLYLDGLDEALSIGPARIVRFEDDFVVLCKTPSIAEKTLKDITTLLGTHGLELHPDKTRIVPFEKGFTFLGHLFVRSLILKQEDTDDPLAAVSEPGGFPLSVSAVPVGGLSVRTLYIIETGRILTARGSTFVVKDGEADAALIPPAELERIEVGPGVEIRPAAFALAFATTTPIMFVDRGGNTAGIAGAATIGRARTIVAQTTVRSDPVLATETARRIVGARIFNERAMLRRLNRKVGDLKVDRACEVLRQTLRKLEIAVSVDVIRGLEGVAASAYWPALGRILRDFGLQVRRRQPPPDPANLMISFTTSLLHRLITSKLPEFGLHPGIGVLHTTLEGDHACASDLIEALRGPFAEALAITLLNAKIVRREHFEIGGDPRCRLLPDGHRGTLRLYEQWLARKVLNRRTGRSEPWREIIEDEARAYREHLIAMNEKRESDWRPFRTDH